MIKLAIFDLDGTLLNTIADLAASTNYSLKTLGFPTHPINNYNFMVGNGINKLFERALPEGSKNETFILKMRALFISHYSKHLTDNSTPYDGIIEVLRKINARGIKLALATNKYQAGAETLMNHFFSEFPFNPILGQRENIPTKPDTHIIKEILEVIPVDPKEVLYLGDSNVDMQTAKNANLIACGVSWGFRPTEELQALNPDHIINKPSEILDIIDLHNLK